MELCVQLVMFINNFCFVRVVRTDTTYYPSLWRYYRCKDQKSVLVFGNKLKVIVLVAS